MEDDLIPEGRRIDDFDGWLRSHGLGAPPVVSVHQEEERARLKEFAAYEASVHQKIFADRDEEEKQSTEERERKLEKWRETKIDVHTSDRILSGVDLYPLAASCDTVFVLVSTWKQFSSDPDDKEANKSIHVSLENFPAATVQDFLSLVDNSKSVQDLSPEAIVDCCQIAHYLQNNTILESTSQILLESVDKDNCMSMCQLADQLNLPRLFESALTTMMQSIESMEDAEAWNYLTPELQERIQVIKSAIQSSVHSRQSRLYFSSLDEYISLFGERVEYYRERLADAKEQHAQMEVGTRSYEDTAEKIRRQESRVRTLQIVLAEQKKVFMGKGVIRRAI